MQALPARRKRSRHPADFKDGLVSCAGSFFLGGDVNLALQRASRGGICECRWDPSPYSVHTEAFKHPCRLTLSGDQKQRSRGDFLTKEEAKGGLRTPLITSG